MVFIERGWYVYASNRYVVQGAQTSFTLDPCDVAEITTGGHLMPSNAREKSSHLLCMIF